MRVVNSQCRGLLCNYISITKIIFLLSWNTEVVVLKSFHSKQTKDSLTHPLKLLSWYFPLILRARLQGLPSVCCSYIWKQKWKENSEHKCSLIIWSICHRRNLIPELYHACFFLSPRISWWVFIGFESRTSLYEPSAKISLSRQLCSVSIHHFISPQILGRKVSGRSVDFWSLVAFWATWWTFLWSYKLARFNTASSGFSCWLSFLSPTSVNLIQF